MLQILYNSKQKIWNKVLFMSDGMSLPFWQKKEWIRIGTDALCVIGGIITQSDVGIGTLVSVLLGGPLISLFRKLLRKLMII